jgi:hypothetical protein
MHKKNPRRTSPKNSIDPTRPLVPHFWYPRSGIIAQGVIGLGRSQQDVKIAAGELPPPCKAFESSRELGWFGWQLLEVIERRRARAQESMVAQAEAKAAAVEKPAELPPNRRRRLARAASDQGTTTAS